MLVLVVVDHDQLAAEAVRNLQRGTIFGVLLRRLRRKKTLIVVPIPTSRERRPLKNEVMYSLNVIARHV